MLFPGFLLFIFLTTIRPQDFVPGLAGLPLVFVVMTGLLVLWCLSGVEKRLLMTVQDKYYALFFLSIVVSTLSVGWLQYTVETVTDTLKTAAIYWLTVTIVNSEARLKTATWSMVVLMTVVAAMGILQYYGHDLTHAGMYWAQDKQTWQVRGAGLFNNPNDLAYSVVLVLPFAIGVLLTGGGALRKGCGLGMLLVAGYCIYLTKSRGGYLAAFVGVLSWMYCWLANRALRRLFLLVGMVAVLGAFSVQTRDYRGDQSSMGRVEAWAAGMDMLTAHPLTGIGKGQFIEHHERDSHNSYVRAGAELGLVGLFAFIGILLSSFRSLVGQLQEEKESGVRLIKIGFLAYLTSYAVGSIFSTRTYDVIFMIAIAFTGVLARLSSRTQETAEEGRSPLPVGMQAGKVSALALLTVVIWKLFLLQVW